MPKSLTSTICRWRIMLTARASVKKRDTASGSVAVSGRSILRATPMDPIAGSVDDAHAAAADLRDDLVVGETTAEHCPPVGGQESTAAARMKSKTCGWILTR